MAFSNLTDQKHAVEVLQRSLKRGRLAHAYLFVNAPLETLEAVARTVAKTLNCQEITESTADIRSDCCDRCDSCRRIQKDIHPDVQTIRPESKSRVITMHQTREFMRSIYLTPTEARYKVCLIAGADRMNPQAANAFLKTLEEPPDRSILILLSTQPDQVLETIRSRCLRLTFSTQGLDAFSESQRSWVEELNGIATEPNAGLLGRYRLLDRLLQRLSEMKESIKAQLTTASPLERYDDVDAKVKERWENELSASIESEYRRQRLDLLSCIQWWLRDVWILTLRADSELLCFENLKDSMANVARRIQPEDAARNLESIETTQALLGTNVQEALALEVGLLKLKL